MFILTLGFQLLAFCCLAENIKQPNVAGTFYPQDPADLSAMLDKMLSDVQSQPVKGQVFALIVPHAGYGFSGPTAAFGYNLVKGRPYKTVVIIAPSHYYAFSGISVYPNGFFRTPLGDIEVDRDFTAKLLGKNKAVYFEPKAFAKEHSLEVQLPFLQKVLPQAKIVPLVMGDCTLSDCRKFADLLRSAIGERDDILLIVSSDMYHGYDYAEAEGFDRLTLSYLKEMDSEGLYYGLREGKLQLCGGLGAVTGLILAQEMGYNKLEVLAYTNSALVTGKKEKGTWTVGYSASVIYKPDKEGEGKMSLSIEQKKKLLSIARSSIQSYFDSKERPQLKESDPVLLAKSGAFVTLHKKGELRGCIGNMVGQEPLYLTIRDMAIAAAFEDPRFGPLRKSELADIEIEISVLSPLEKIDNPDKIKMGEHGVLLKRGFNSGVFLPQVACETGWSKEEFLANLCEHKAGLPADAWKDKSCQLYIFTADIFSENQLKQK